MLKNNLKAFMIHVVISFICLLIFDLAGELIYNVNTSSYKDYIHLVKALIIFIVAIFLYYTLSKKYLEKFSIKKDMLSLLLVTIIGVSLWLISYNFMENGFLKLYYQMYNAYSLPLFSVFNIKNSYLAGVFVIIPSLLMYIGIQCKSRSLGVKRGVIK